MIAHTRLQTPIRRQCAAHLNKLYWKILFLLIAQVLQLQSSSSPIHTYIYAPESSGIEPECSFYAASFLSALNPQTLYRALRDLEYFEKGCFISENISRTDHA